MPPRLGRIFGTSVTAWGCDVATDTALFRVTRGTRKLCSPSDTLVVPCGMTLMAAAHVMRLPLLPCAWCTGGPCSSRCPDQGGPVGPGGASRGCVQSGVVSISVASVGDHPRRPLPPAFGFAMGECPWRSAPPFARFARCSRLPDCRLSRWVSVPAGVSPRMVTHPSRVSPSYHDQPAPHDPQPASRLRASCPPGWVVRGQMLPKARVPLGRFQLRANARYRCVTGIIIRLRRCPLRSPSTFAV